MTEQAPPESNTTVTADSAYQQHYFFNLFTERFMDLIADVKPVLEHEYPQLLSDFITNLHRLSEHAVHLLAQQQIDFLSLSEAEQTLFLNQFVQHIESFAHTVHESISNITPEQAEKLKAAYADKRSRDN